jgi:hypothetical protein
LQPRDALDDAVLASVVETTPEEIGPFRAGGGVARAHRLFGSKGIRIEQPFVLVGSLRGVAGVGERFGEQQAQRRAVRREGKRSAKRRDSIGAHRKRFLP